MNASIWVVNLVFALLGSIGIWALACWAQEHIKQVSVGAGILGVGLLAAAFQALPGFTLALSFATLANWTYRESDAPWKSRLYRWL